MDLKRLLQSNSNVFSDMLRNATDGTRPDRMDSFQFYDWVGQFLPVEEGYCEDKLIKAHELIGIEFPPDPPPTQHTKIGANDIGYS